MIDCRKFLRDNKRFLTGFCRFSCPDCNFLKVIHKIVCASVQRVNKYTLGVWTVKSKSTDFDSMILKKTIIDKKKSQLKKNLPCIYCLMVPWDGLESKSLRLTIFVHQFINSSFFIDSCVTLHPVWQADKEQVRFQTHYSPQIAL